MRDALRDCHGKGETAQLLALISLAAWINWKGSRAPTARQLGAVFRSQEKWVSTVYDVWPDCSGGRPISDEFVQHAITFWNIIRHRKKVEQDSIVDAAISAKDSFNKLLRRPSPAISFEALGIVPVEVRPINTKWVHEVKIIKPQQSNMKGLTDKEVYMLWIC